MNSQNSHKLQNSQNFQHRDVQFHSGTMQPEGPAQQSRTSQLRSRLLLLFACMMMSLSCQHINEPSDLVVGEGFLVRIALQSQSGEALSSAQLEWKILRGATTGTTDSAIGDWRSFSTVAAGTFEATIPVQLSNRNDRVIIKTHYTGADVAQYAASLPLNGKTERLDTIKVCGNARIVLELTKQVPPVCCGASSSENLRLSVVVPTFPNDSAASSIMSVDQLCNENSITFSAPVVNPVDQLLSFKIRRLPSGTLQNLPQNIARGESFQIVCYYNAPLSGTPPAGIRSYTAVVTGSTASNANCVSVNLNINRELTVNAQCDCPLVRDTTLFVPSDSTKTVALCVGASRRYDTLQIPLAYQISNSADTSCLIQITLDQQVVDPDVSVISFNGNTNYTRIVLQPKTGLTQGPVFAAQATRQGTINASLKYRVQVVDAKGSTKDCGFMTYVYHGFGEGSRCVIDSAASTIFKKVNGKYVLDTLQECVSNIIVCGPNNTQVNNPRTLVVRNAGRCPLTLNNPTMSNTKFAVSSGNTQLDPNDTASYQVAFTPTRDDLWPGKRGSAAVPFHNAVLTLGCNLGSLNLVGKADSCPQSVSLNLRQWALSNSYYEGIVIQPARAEKSGDARKLGNGAEIFANLVNAAAGTLDGGTYVKTGSSIVQFQRVASGINIVGKICDSYPNGTFGILNSTTGWSKSINFANKDVIAFRKDTDEGGSGCYLYGIIWIQQIDADGANPGAFIVTMDFCYPM